MNHVYRTPAPYAVRRRWRLGVGSPLGPLVIQDILDTLDNPTATTQAQEQEATE